MAQWKDLSLTPTGPREASLFKKIPTAGGNSQAYRFAGMLTLLGASGTVIPLLLLPVSQRPQVGLILFGGIFFACFSVFFFQLAKSYQQQRLRFLQAGTLVKAHVLCQGSRFNPFSSTPHTTLTLALNGPDSAPNETPPIEVTGLLWQREAARELKIGSEVWILALPEEEGNWTYWCPFEVGLRLCPSAPEAPSDHTQG